MHRLHPRRGIRHTRREKQHHIGQMAQYMRESGLGGRQRVRQHRRAAPPGGGGRAIREPARFRRQAVRGNRQGDGPGQRQRQGSHRRRRTAQGQTRGGCFSHARAQHPIQHRHADGRAANGERKDRAPPLETPHLDQAIRRKLAGQVRSADFIDQPVIGSGRPGLSRGGLILFQPPDASHLRQHAALFRQRVAGSVMPDNPRRLAARGAGAGFLNNRRTA